MSAPSGPDRCEPNMTPMLDMVLQLVMFFMLCANFLMEEVNEKVQLPTANSPRGLTKANERMVFVNLTQPDAQNPRGAISAFNGTYTEDFGSPVQLKEFLQRRFERDKEVATQKGISASDFEGGMGKSLIILRADGRCEYKQVDEVMRAAKAAGYSDVQLRAKKASG